MQNIAMPIETLLKAPPFSLGHKEKQAFFTTELGKLNRHHFAHCQEYRRILETLKFDPAHDAPMANLPFLPVRLFKQYRLSSVPPADVVKTLVSSGTSGQVSQIALDKVTGILQKKVLGKIVADFIGKDRLPMLLLDSETTLKNPAAFSARGAGILGFSIFGKDVTYAFDERMQLNLPVVEAFLEKHRSEKILLFGFTFMIWEHFYRALKNSGRQLALENGILIHGGGWKKLQDQAVGTQEFKRCLADVSRIAHVHNYYGMVEQTGSIFMECDEGHFHCSVFSDVLMRRNDFSLCKTDEPGLIELISLLPLSYPGHVLLSEDMGEIRGEDDCPCGRLGKYFVVHGRVQNAEVRGCSDTYQV